MKNNGRIPIILKNNGRIPIILKGSYPITKVCEVLSDTEIGEPTPTWSVYKDGCSLCQIGNLEHKLDYIFTTRDIKTESFMVGDSRASDHLPVIAVVEF